MEGNNGRTEEKTSVEVTPEELVKKFQELQEVAKTLYLENTQLKNNWVLSRFSCLVQAYPIFEKQGMVDACFKVATELVEVLALYKEEKQENKQEINNQETNSNQ